MRQFELSEENLCNLKCEMNKWFKDFFSYKSYFGATTSHGRKYSMKTLKKTSAYCAQGLIIAPGP